MKILNVTNLASKSIPTNLFFDNSIMLIEADNTFNNVGLCKYNIETNQNKNFKFDKMPDIISYVSAKKTLFYGELDTDFTIKIKKFSCDDWVENYSLTLNTEFIINANGNDYNPFIDSRLIGLNERYAIWALPHSELIYGRPFFEKILLIDTLEKQSIEIQNKISEFDSLLRLDDAWIINNGEYILFKTGRIRPSEKRNLWDEGIKKDNNEIYFDNIETLISITVEDFIENVKRGIELPESAIIQTVDYRGCLKFLENGVDITENNNGNIIFVVESFLDNTTDFVFYDYINKQPTVKRINNIFKDIRYYNGVFYSVIPNFIDRDIQKDKTPKKELSHIEIFDIFCNKKVNTNKDGNLVYIDDKLLVTSKFLKGLSKEEITVFDLVNGNKNIFYTNHSLYFSMYDLLLLY